MACFSCNRGCDCTALAVVVGVVIGIIAAILRFLAVITVTPVFLWVLFGIAIALLAIAFITSASGTEATGRCACSALSVFLVGTLGTVLTSVILLGIAFAATSVIGAIVTGLLAGFFASALTAVACLVRNAAGCGE